MTKQCSSCGGICGGTKKTGCLYENAPAAGVAGLADLGRNALDEIARLREELEWLNNWQQNYTNEVERKMDDLKDKLFQSKELASSWRLASKTKNLMYNNLINRILAGTNHTHIDDWLKEEGKS